jgi:hypothetical protein
VLRPLIVTFILLAGCTGEAPDLQPDPVSASEPSARGRLVVTPHELTVDATQTSGGSPAEVELQNAGDAPLKVENVRTYCGCAQALPLERTILAPGESVELVISLTPPQVGDKETRVVVETDSELTPSCEIPIHMTGRQLVPPYISESPGQVEMRAKQAAGLAEATFHLHTVERAGSGFWVIGMDSSDATVTATVIGQPVEQESVDKTVLRHYTIAVTAQAPPSTTEKVNARLRPVTAGESTRHIPQIVVNLELDPPVRPVPESLYISLDDGQVFPVVRRLILRAGDDSEWDVESPQGLPEWMSVERSTLNPAHSRGRVIALSVAISHHPDLLRQDHAVTMTFACSHPECPVVSVPVRITHADRDE